ncbi:MAG: hypothetical protein GY913_06830 [Proteobacteria bacterium]|nr:hypothetical protein [Pseudomonadota bacterium]MCP4916621.1 hypothetical protein [Pseudomonadota bacterium]
MEVWLVRGAAVLLLVNLLVLAGLYAVPMPDDDVIPGRAARTVVTPGGGR